MVARTKDTVKQLFDGMFDCQCLPLSDATINHASNLDRRGREGAKKKFLPMLRQHSQYDSRLEFSFRVLVRVRVRLWLG